MLQKALILFLFATVKSQTTTVTKFPSTPPSPLLLPQLNLTSNSSQIYLNIPFKLTCSIAHFNASGKRYSVNYYDSRDSLLATYKVDGKNFHNKLKFKRSKSLKSATGKSLLSVGMSTDLFAHHGPRSSFPAFDLVITERTDPHQRYWCELEIEEKTSKKIQSNFWAFTGIFAHFNTTSTVLVKNGAQIERQGRCSITGFELHNKTEFKVEYHYFLKANGHRALFAYYWLQRKQTKTFFKS